VQNTDLAVAMVIDKSGSMGWLKEPVIEGFNSYLADLRQQEGNTIFSLTVFDTNFDERLIGVPLEDVKPWVEEDYRPNGNTALYDAIAFTIDHLDKRLKRTGHAKMKRLVCVITDGQENSSIDFSIRDGGQERLAELVKSYEDTGLWTFVYLGMGQSMEVASRYAEHVGVPVGNVMATPYTAAAVHATTSSLAGSTYSLRSSSAGSTQTYFNDAGQTPEDYSGEKEND
jgi:uncharacterized protein YegL